MEREKSYIPPMTGQEVFDMFGDRRLLRIEERQKELETRMDELAKKLEAARENPEADWEAVDLLESEFGVAREMMKENQKLIREIGMDFGKKRGPVTLH